NAPLIAPVIAQSSAHRRALLRPNAVRGCLLAAMLVPACADDTGSAGAQDTEQDGTSGTDGGTMDAVDETSQTGADDGSSDGGETPPGVAAARMALEPLVAALCEHAFACCNADEMAFQIGSAIADAAQCTSTTLDVLEAGGNPPYLQSSQISLHDVLPFFAYGLNPDEVVVDEAAFAACAEAIVNQPCAASAGSEGRNCVAPEVVDLEACDLDLLFIGQRAAGEDCSTYRGFECAPGLLCDFFDAVSGVCVETLSVGDACFADYNCYGDLLCDYGTGTCTAPAQLDEACAYANPEDPQIGTETTRCAGNLVCDPITETCGSQTCGFGSSCDADEECPQGLSCVQYRCDFLGVTGEECFQDGDCAAGPCVYTGFGSVCHEIAADGEACEQHNGCASNYCDPATGECTEQLAAGTACDPTAPAEQCEAGYCDGVDCVAFGDLGDACPAVQCNYIENHQCWDGTCQAFPLPDGQPCGSPSDCQSGSCSTVCQPPPAVGDACTLGGCGTDAFCALTDGNDGTCQARRGRGELCTSSSECWGGCEPVFGELRCYGNAPGIAFCDGE
ncbi:MAG: hypothetical protein AAF721_37585, partial [Myxococcota bacterium]